MANTEPSGYIAYDDTTLTVAAPGVLGSDTDPDGDALTAVLVSSPATGTLTLNANGSFTYVPARGQIVVASFTYQAKDPSGALSAPSTVDIIVEVATPIPVADIYSTPADVTLSVGTSGGVLANDIYGLGPIEFELGSMTAKLDKPPTLGTVTLAKDGSFTYIPKGTTGVDTFTYLASGDLAGRTPGVGTVTITVTTPNRAPVAVADAYTTAEDAPLTVPASGVLVSGVLGNDADGDVLTAVLVSGPAHGTLTLNGDGSFTYAPAANFNAADSFTYQAKDPKGLLSSTVTVSLTVTAVNDAPTVSVAVGGSCGVNDRSGTVNPLVADEDSPLTGLTVTATSSNPALVPSSLITFGGSGANRTMSVSTLPGRTGTAVITVTVSDGTMSSTVPITVKAAGHGNNTVVGTEGADILFGQNGDDALSGLGGNDLLCGGSGNDVLSGGVGDDTVFGGSGNDRMTG